MYKWNIKLTMEVFQLRQSHVELRIDPFVGEGA